MKKAPDLLAFQELREKFPQVFGERFSGNLPLRVHRAISWGMRAEREMNAKDYDAAFIFYWISFNAAYAEDTAESSETVERHRREGYFNKILRLDADRSIYNAIWDRFSNSIRVLLNNKYVFQPFWNHHNGVPGHANWEAIFDSRWQSVQRALVGQDTAAVLNNLFDRLYVLRNQLLHGGATWNSSVNRRQVEDGARIMEFLTPVFIKLMMDHPDISWGAAYYPVVEP